MPLDAEALVAQLQLMPHPEGGWYRELFKSHTAVTRSDGSARNSVSLIWFLLGVGHRSVWHRIAGGDEVWYFVDGGPLELTWIDSHGVSGRVVLGPRGSGFSTSCVIPADAWQAAKPLDEPSLVQCSVSPAFDFADFAMLRDRPSELAALRAHHDTLLTPSSLG
jgi:uncharacterized protein